MTRALLATICLVLAAPAAAQDERLTADRAVAMAMANSRRIANAGLEAAKAEAEVATARSRRLPQFSVEIQASQLLRPVDVWFPQGSFGQYPGIGPVPAADTSVRTPATPALLFNAQVVQPLSQLHRMTLDVRMSEAARAFEQEAARASRLTVAYDVRRLYFAIVQTESAIVAADHSLVLLREVQRVVSDRLVQRTALESESMTVDVRLARAQAERAALANTAATQKERLNLLLGRDIDTPFQTAGVPGADPGIDNVEAAEMRALESRPDVRQARVRLAQAEIARNRARADFIPDVSLALSYLSPMNVDGAPRNIASVGLQLQWEPFDWGRRSRAVAARGLAVEQAANAVRDQEDQARVEINALVRQLSEARTMVRVAALAQGAARETGRVRAAQYRVQAALLSDVLHAASAQADADHQYLQALASLWAARAEFERALGEE